MRGKDGKVIAAIALLLGLAMVGSAVVVAAPPRPAQQRQTMANLRAIGQSLLMYVAENRGYLPDSLGQTVKDTRSASIYVTPASPDHADPAEADKLPLEQQMAWVKDHSDLAYAGAGVKMSRIRNSTQWPMVVTRTQPDGDGIYVLFGDGHVEHFTAAEPPASSDSTVTTQPAQ